MRALSEALSVYAIVLSHACVIWRAVGEPLRLPRIRALDLRPRYAPCECGCWPTPRDQRERTCRVCGDYAPASWYAPAP